MPVLSLIDHNDPKLSQDEVMTKIHEVSGIYFTQFKKNDKGWAAHLHIDEDKAKLLSLEVRRQLRAENIEILKSPEYKAACSIVIVTQPNVVFKFGGIKEFKEQFAQGANTEVEDVVILNSFKIVVELTTPEESARVRRQTVIMDGERFEPKDMEPQRFAKVTQCSKCYSFAHERGDCTETQQYCFICGETGHAKDDCPKKENPVCKNCYDSHVAIAFKCPFRKVRQHELDPDNFSVSLFVLRQVYNAQCRTAGVTPQELDVEQTRSVCVGHPNPLLASASSTEEMASDSEGAMALPPGDRERVADLVIDVQEFSEVMQSTIRKICATLMNAGIATVEDDEEEEEDEEVEEIEQRPTSSWRSVRRVRAPNPERGEGPRRQLRKIIDFKQPISVTVPKKVRMADYPVLPKRKLRRCVVPLEENVNMERFMELVS